MRNTEDEENTWPSTQCNAAYCHHRNKITFENYSENNESKYQKVKHQETIVYYADLLEAKKNVMRRKKIY